MWWSTASYVIYSSSWLKVNQHGCPLITGYVALSALHWWFGKCWICPGLFLLYDSRVFRDKTVWCHYWFIVILNTCRDGYSSTTCKQVKCGKICSYFYTPDNKVHGANMGPIWGLQDLGGPHVGPMNFAIWDVMYIDVINDRWILLKIHQEVTFDNGSMKQGRTRHNFDILE